MDCIKETGGKRILVTGANGFVGKKLMERCGNAVPSPSLRGITQEGVSRILEESGADVIVHTAAISDIGSCQRNPEESYSANVQIPVYLARAAGKRKLVCFSSDQVYSGCEQEGPYLEDTVKPANIYAEHKLEMENRVLDILPDAVMLRAEWMYDFYSPKGNYFLNVLRAKESVSFSSGHYRGITYLREVAENMEKVFALPGGSYNFGSETTKNMYEITQEFVSLLGLDVKVKDEPPRHNLWMNCGKASKYGVTFSSVTDGLAKCAADYGLV